MDMERKVRIGYANVWPFAVFVTEIVGYGILYPVRHKLGVTEIVAIDNRVNGKAVTQVHVLLPVHLAADFIHVIGAVGLKVKERFEDTDCGTQMKIGLVHQGLVSFKGHHSVTNGHPIGSQINKFFCKNLFQPLEGLGNHFKFCHLQLMMFQSAKIRILN